MIGRTRRVRLDAVALTALACAVWPATAHAETRAYVDLSAGATAATNPFLQTGSGNGSIGVSAEVRPALVSENEVQRLELSGDFRVTQYLQRHGTEPAGGVNLSVSRRLSEYITAFGGVSFRSSRQSLRDSLRSRIEGLALGDAASTPPVGEPSVPRIEYPDLIDFDLDQAGSRTNMLQANAGLAVRLSAKDSVSIGLSTILNRYDDDRRSDFRYSAASVGYARQVSPRTDVTLDVTVGESAYLDQREGDGYLATALVGIQRRLNTSLTLSAKAGLTHVRSARAVAGHDDSTSWAASLSLCDARANRSICLNAARTAQPTSEAGVNTVTTAGVDFSQMLNQRDRLSLSAQYARTGEIERGLGRSAQTLMGASATLSRSISQRLSAFVSPSFERQSSFSTRTNYQVSAGISYRLGAVR